MNAILSDDREWVIVLDNDDSSEELTVKEFIEVYGEDAFSTLERSLIAMIDERELVSEYYHAFRELCAACGKYAWADKTARNAVNGVYPVQKMLWERHGYNAISKLELEIFNFWKLQNEAVDALNECSKRAGCGQMRPEGKDVLVRHLYDPDFRDRMYYRVDKYAKEGVLHSPEELVIEVLKSLRNDGHHYVIKAPD